MNRIVYSLLGLILYTLPLYPQQAGYILNYNKYDYYSYPDGRAWTAQKQYMVNGSWFSFRKDTNYYDKDLNQVLFAQWNDYLGDMSYLYKRYYYPLPSAVVKEGDGSSFRQMSCYPNPADR